MEKATNPALAKSAVFYQDGTNRGEGLRVVLHPNRFRNLEALLEFLTAKIPDLPFGVRSIFSPRGRTKVLTLDEVNDDGHYIASDQRQRARGIQLAERSILLPNWKAGRPPSGQKLLSYNLKLDVDAAPSDGQAAPSNRPIKPTWKVIYVHQNGDAFHRHRVAIERKLRGTLEFVLKEISFQLRQPVHKLYTLDGLEVTTFDYIFTNPTDEYIAVGLEKLRPLSKAQVDLSRKRHRPPLGRPCIHHGPSNLRHRSGLCDRQSNDSGSPNRSIEKPEVSRSYNPEEKRSFERVRGSAGGGGGMRQSTSVGKLAAEGSVKVPLRSKRHVPGGDYWFIRLTLGRMDCRSRQEYSIPCSANVYLTVQGTRGCTAPLLLSSYQKKVAGRVSGKPNATLPEVSRKSLLQTLFSPGGTDEFEVNFGAIGEVVKVRLSHDDSGESPGLFVSHLRMLRLDPGAPSQTATVTLNSTKNPPRPAPRSTSVPSLRLHSFNDLTFYFNCWLARDRSDGEIVREVPSKASAWLLAQAVEQDDHEDRKRPVPQPRRHQLISPVLPASVDMKELQEEPTPLPMVRYSIRVKTGSLWNSGTDAAVNITLNGNFGDSGPRRLWKQIAQNEDIFKQDQVDEFTVDCVHLGRLISLRLWLDEAASSPGASFYISWVHVAPSFMGGIPNGIASPRKSEIDLQLPCLFDLNKWIGGDGDCREVDAKPLSHDVGLLYRPSEPMDFATPCAVAKLWESMMWKFEADMEIVLYSALTGDPLVLLPDNRVVARIAESSIQGEIFTVCATDYVAIATSTNPRRFILLANGKSKSGRRLKQFRDPDPKLALPVFQFKSTSRPGSALQVRSDGLLGVVEVAEARMPIGQFLVRPQLDSWMILESIPREDQVDREVSRVCTKMGDDGSIAVEDSSTSTSTSREFLFLPHVKGLLRDCGVILLCTSAEQALVPRYDIKDDGQSERGLVVWATGKQEAESYWRVHRQDRKLRAFESVGFPGHYLRIMGPGKCDAMGSGGSDCYFTIHYEKSAGFLRLEGFENAGLLIYILPGGYVSASIGRKRVESLPTSGVNSVKSGSTDQSDPSSSLGPSSGIDANQVDSEENTSESTIMQSSLQRGNTIEKTVDRTSEWKVRLSTLESAYNSLVVLVVYGARANSGPIILGSSDGAKQLFRAGSVDEFKISLVNIGAIYKIRLEVTSVDDAELPYWGLQKIIFENMNGSDCLHFDFTNRPFIRTYSHCQLSREQTLHDVNSDRPQRERFPPEVLRPDHLDPSVGVVFYRARVVFKKTSKRGKEGTANSVLRCFQRGRNITLFGCYGDTGKRMMALTNPVNSHSDQELKTFDCLLESVYLGPLERCSIGPVISTNERGPVDAASVCLGLDVTDPLTGDIVNFPANVWIAHESPSKPEDFILIPNAAEKRQEATSSHVEASVDSTDYVHAAVARMVEEITDVATVNVKKYKFWQDPLLEESASNHKSTT